MSDEEPDSPAAKIARQEIFSHILAYVALGNEMATRTAQLHAEIERVLKDLARLLSMGSEPLKQLAADTHALRDKVNDALEAAETLPAQLKAPIDAIAGLPGQITAQVADMGRTVLESVALQFEQLYAAKRDARRTDLRHWLALGLGGVAITLAVVAAVSFLDPGLDQVQRRRAELAALRREQDQILLHSVHQDGGLWVPATETAKACVPEGSKNCTLYARVQ